MKKGTKLVKASQPASTGGNFTSVAIGRTLQSQKLGDLIKLRDKFEDRFFPPDDSSLYSSNPKVKGQDIPEVPSFIQKTANKTKFLSQFALSKKDKNYSWRRLSELCDASKLNLTKDSGNKDEGLIKDVIQGELGDCYFLSVLSALGENPNRIRSLFPNTKQLDKGVYEALIYLHGNPTLVCVDDYFPVIEKEGSEQIAFAGINQETKNIWPMILEKIWAKCNNSYEDIISGNSSEAFGFLTPAPYDTYHHKADTSKLFEIIEEANKKDYIIVADISETENTNLVHLSKLGLVTNHAYAVIDTAVLKDSDEKHTYRLLKLRNVWNTNEWLGDWSDNSKLWSDTFREQVGGVPKKDDGIFWMSIEDYIQFYSTTHICKIHDNYKFTSQKFEISNDHPFCMVNVNVPKDTTGYFEVNLKNTRIYSKLKGKPDYQNPYCNMTVFLKENDEYVYIGSDSGRQDRLYVEVEEMKKGNYYIAVSFPKKKSEFNISEDMEVAQFDKMNYRIGIYSPNDNMSINPVSEEVQKELATFLDDIIADMARNNEEEKYYLSKEGDKNSYRVIHFDDDKNAFGYIYYENNSEAFIKEKLSFTELNNVNVLPILSDGKFKKLEISKEDELEFEDPYIQKDINRYRTDTKLKSSAKILNPVKSYSDISEDNPLEIEFKIAPQAIGIIILQKTDEDSVIDLRSEICLEYLLDTLLSGKLFKAKIFKLKYNNKPTEIYECVTEHTTGAIFQYKNKTNDLRMVLTVSFASLNNLELAEKTEDVTIEEAGRGKKVVLIVGPGETKYFSVRAINVFEKFNYATNIDYSFGLAEEKIKSLKFA